MRHLFIVVIAILFNLNLFASELTARLYFADDQVKTLIPGELFQTQLQIFNPSDAIRNFDFKQLEGQTFADHFYVVTVQRFGQNENNADVWNIDFTLVLKNYFDREQPIIATVGNANFPLATKFVKIENISEQDKEFILLDQDYHHLFSYWWRIIAPVVLGIFALIVGALLFVRYRKKLKQKRNLAEEKKRWVTLIIAAKERPQWEYLYQHRTLWIDHLSSKELADAFVAVMEHIQYQKEWSESDCSQLSDAYLLIVNDLGGCDDL